MSIQNNIPDIEMYIQRVNNMFMRLDTLSNKLDDLHQKGLKVSVEIANLNIYKIIKKLDEINKTSELESLIRYMDLRSCENYEELKNRVYYSSLRIENSISLMREAICRLTNKDKKPSNEILDSLVIDLELSNRSEHCLLNAGICTVGSLLDYDDNSLLAIKNMGRKSLNEIKDVLSEKGLSLRKREETK